MCKIGLSKTLHFYNCCQNWGSKEIIITTFLPHSAPKSSYEENESCPLVEVHSSTVTRGPQHIYKLIPAALFKKMCPLSLYRLLLKFVN